MNVGPSARDSGRLSFLTKSPLERLTPYAQPQYFSKGASITGGAQLCEAAYLILSGGCELRRGLPDGQQQVIENLGPGAAFGGLEKVDGEETWTTVVATADTVVLRLERESFAKLRDESVSATPTTATIQAGQGASATTTATGATSSERRRLPRHIVTLAFLSEQLPARDISEQLARRLCAETDSQVVLVRFAAQDDNSQPEAQPQFFLNGEFHMPSRLNKTTGGFYSVTLGIRNAEPPSTPGIASLVSHLSRHFRHVLIEGVASDCPAPWLTELLNHSDIGYLFLPPTPEAVCHLNQIFKCCRSSRRKEAPSFSSTLNRDQLEPPHVGCYGLNQHVQLKPIGCLLDGGPMHGFDILAPSLPTPIHFFVRDCAPMELVSANTQSSRRFNADIGRLAREIGGRLLGLALSSGAAKGFAHIGVIQVLEENGIEVDVVAGASMGAYVVSIWSYGCEGSQLERLAREMEGKWALWSLIDPVFPPRQGFMRGYALKKRLMRSIGNVRFSELVRPLRVVAGNLATLERVVFSSGEVAEAVHASVAVPGICVPITIGGETFVDGGIVDPLPVDVLREMGVSRVIAVDVIPTPDRIRVGLQLERALAQDHGARARRFFRKALPLNEKLNYFAPGNLFEILMRSIQGAQIRVAEASCQMADLVLRPDICGDRWGDCAKPAKFIALGREVALKHLDEIKALAERKEVSHEPNFASEPVAAID